ncbi:MAG: hypothetical protein WA648_05425, partial [Methylocella sp.]
RAKAALSAGVMSSAGLPVHMQRSIHVPDHIVKRCVRLYTRANELTHFVFTVALISVPFRQVAPS